jgi:phytanoyl-CoA dioxygenase PhyH
VRRTAQIEFLSSAVMREGIAAAPGAFPPEWADRLREDFDAAFDAARATEGGLVDRGPNRWYFAVHPERLRGFLDLTTHPLVRGLSESVLGPGFHYVKVGFDVPAPGAVDQPWHRDFPAPGTPSLTSLAFNVNTVDVEPDMGPLEIAAGTHRDDGRDFIDGMFSPANLWPRYEALATRRHPRRGDLSAHSGLAVHRGTANTSGRRRAVLILGATTAATATPVHEIQVTRGWAATFPPVCSPACAARWSTSWRRSPSGTGSPGWPPRSGRHPGSSAASQLGPSTTGPSAVHRTGSMHRRRAVRSRSQAW